jgi:ATP-dependent DNA helicase HFM1/MER3
MKRLEDELHSVDGQRIRLVAISATIPNLEDVRLWLSYKNENAICRQFGEEYRPVPLRKFVLGFPTSKSPYTFEYGLAYKLRGIIDTYSDKQPTLIVTTLHS